MIPLLTPGSVQLKILTAVLDLEDANANANASHCHWHFPFGNSVSGHLGAKVTSEGR